MKAMCNIRRTWVTSNILIAVGILLLATVSAEVGLTTMGSGVILGGAAWLAAMGHAIAHDEMEWFGLLLFPPTTAIAMWGYVLEHRNGAPGVPPPASMYSTGPSYPPYPPYPAPSFGELNEPLVLRQAIEVVEETLRRPPEP